MISLSCQPLVDLLLYKKYGTYDQFKSCVNKCFNTLTRKHKDIAWALYKFLNAYGFIETHVQNYVQKWSSCNESIIEFNHGDKIAWVKKYTLLHSGQFYEKALGSLFIDNIEIEVKLPALKELPKEFEINFFQPNGHSLLKLLCDCSTALDTIGRQALFECERGSYLSQFDFNALKWVNPDSDMPPGYYKSQNPYGQVSHFCKPSSNSNFLVFENPEWAFLLSGMLLEESIYASVANDTLFIKPSYFHRLPILYKRSLIFINGCFPKVIDRTFLINHFNISDHDALRALIPHLKVYKYAK